MPSKFQGVFLVWSRDWSYMAVIEKKKHVQKAYP